MNAENHSSFQKIQSSFMGKFFYKINHTNRYRRTRAMVVLIFCTAQVYLGVFVLICSSPRIKRQDWVINAKEFLKYLYLPWYINSNIVFRRTIFWGVKLVPFFMCLVLIVYKSKVLNERRISWMRQLYCFYSSTWIWVWSALIWELLLLDIMCLIFQSDVCDKILLLEFCIDLVVFALLVIFTLIQLRYYRTDRIDKADYFRKQADSLELVIFIWKIVMCSVYMFPYNLLHEWVFITGILIGFSITLLTVIYITYKRAFVDIRIQRYLTLGLILNLIQLMSVIYSYFFSYFTNKMEQADQIFFFQCIFYCLGYMVSLRLDSQYYVLLDESLIYIKSKAISLSNLIFYLKQTSSSSFNRLILEGFLALHSFGCCKVRCLCNGTRMQYNGKLKKIVYPSFEADGIKASKYIVIEMLERSVDSKKVCLERALFLAECYAKKLRSFPKAMFLLSLCDRIEMSSYSTFKIYILRKMMIDEQNGENNSNFPTSDKLSSIIDAEKVFKRSVSQMKNISINIFQFWVKWKSGKQLNSRELDIELSSIISNLQRCKESFHELSGFMNINKMYRVYYLWFCKDFLGKKLMLGDGELTNLTTMKVLGRLKSDSLMKDLHIPSLMFDVESAIFHVSIDKERIGMIKKCNIACVYMFGYKKSELEFANISKLIPEPLSQTHNELLASFFSNPLYQSRNNQVDTYAIRSDGYLIPISIFILLVGMPNGVVELISLIRKREVNPSRKGVAIIDSNGTLYCGTKQFFRISDPIALKNTGQYPINIPLLAPSLLKGLQIAECFAFAPQISSALQDKMFTRYNDINSELLQVYEVESLADSQDACSFPKLLQREEIQNGTLFMLSPKNKMKIIREFWEAVQKRLGSRSSQMAYSQSNVDKSAIEEVLDTDRTDAPIFMTTIEKGPISIFQIRNMEEQIGLLSEIYNYSEKIARSPDSAIFKLRVSIQRKSLHGLCEYSYLSISKVSRIKKKTFIRLNSTLSKMSSLISENGKHDNNTDITLFHDIEKKASKRSPMLLGPNEGDVSFSVTDDLNESKLRRFLGGDDSICYKEEGYGANESLRLIQSVKRNICCILVISLFANIVSFILHDYRYRSEYQYNFVHGLAALEYLESSIISYNAILDTRLISNG